MLGASFFVLYGMVYTFVSMMGSQAVQLASIETLRGEAFVGAADKAMAPAAEGISSTYPATQQAASLGQGFSPETQLALFLAIVVVSLVVGFLIAKAKR